MLTTYSMERTITPFTPGLADLHIPKSYSSYILVGLARHYIVKADLKTMSRSLLISIGMSSIANLKILKQTF